MTVPFVPIITTKLKPPRLSNDLLIRSRLLNILDKNKDKSVTVIIGPAGFGKTTLLNQWWHLSERSQAKTGWFSLDSHDNQTEQFLSYFCGAIKLMEPQLAVEIDHFLEQGAALSPLAVMTQLINGIAEQNASYCLFLDDYHEITNKEITEVIQLLINNLPQNLNLYFGSRQMPALSLSQLKIAGELNTIGQQAMLFDEKEIRQFFAKKDELNLSEQQLKEIINSTEGWPAALQLVSLSLHESVNNSEIITSITKTDFAVTNFLAEEVFRHVSDDDFSCLLLLSASERFCGSLFYHLLERDDLERVVRNLLDAGLLQQLEEQEPWYRFHPLLRGFLLNKLKNLGDEVFTATQLKTAVWFEQHGNMVDAAHHYIEAGEQDQTLRLLDEHAFEMMEQGHLQFLCSTIEKIPLVKIDQCQNILLALAWSKLLAHDLENIPTLVDQLGAMLRQIGESEQRLFQSQICIIRATLAALAEDFNGCQLELEQLTTHNLFVTVTALNLQGLCYLNNYRFELSCQCQQQAFSYRQQLKNKGSYIYTNLFNGLTKFEQARLNDVHMAAQEIDNISHSLSQSNNEVTASSMAKLLSAVAYYQQGQLGKSEQLIEFNSFVMKNYTFIDFLLKLVLAKGRMLQVRGQLQTAKSFYLDYRDVAKDRQSIRLHACIVYEEVRMHLNSNDELGARQVLKNWWQQTTVDDGAEVGPDGQVAEWIELANIRLNIYQGATAQTEQQLIALVERFARQGRIYRQLDATLLLAVLYQSLKRNNQAVQAVADALVLDIEHVWIQPFVDEGIHLLSCYRQFVRSETAELQQAHCQLVINHIVSSPADNVALSNIETSTKQLTDPLTVKESRVLTLIAQGLSNREVAEQLSVSIDTVKSHLKTTYSKMGVNRRTQAVSLARELKLID